MPQRMSGSVVRFSSFSLATGFPPARPLSRATAAYRFPIHRSLLRLSSPLSCALPFASSLAFSRHPVELSRFRAVAASDSKSQGGPDNRDSLGGKSGSEGNHEGLRWHSSTLYKLRGSLEATERRSEEKAEPLVGSSMADFFDLEKQFSFYGAYHSNKVNILIHVLFVWPIFYTGMIPLAYTASIAPLPLAGGTLPLQHYMVLNWSFVSAAIYSLYYVALDKKAGSLGAAMCLGCWIGANAVAQSLPWSVSWKIVLASQILCWSAQIYGHQKFEGRAPALLDNLPQAFLMAPFFVLLELLQTVFGYEPYPGFHSRVQKKVDDSIRKFRASGEKKAA